MPIFCESGFRISSVDKLALENDLLITPFEWSRDCLKGMINKATKTLVKDNIEKLKATSSSISTSISSIIPQIIAMPEFCISKLKAPELPEIQRTEELSLEIWSGGFPIESHELLALQAYYEDPEATFRWFMTNKIHACRKRMVSEWTDKFIKERLAPTIPSAQDDLINLVTQKQGYKNRALRQANASVALMGE